MTPFKTFRRFNDPALHELASLRHRADRRALELFAGPSVPDRIATALAERAALDLKELLESFEFFARVRRRVRAPQVADVCAGHGLAGLLFAVFEPMVERVTIVDRKKPASHAVVLDAVASVAPWAPAKVRYLEIPLSQAANELRAGTSVTAVHACGVRTDRAIDLAVELDGNIAAMPCCYAKTAPDAPKAVRRALGRQLTTDIHRTYRLERAGYQVDWSAIPEAITPMNRVIVGWHPRT